MFLRRCAHRFTRVHRPASPAVVLLDSKRRFQSHIGARTILEGKARRKRNPVELRRDERKNSVLRRRLRPGREMAVGCQNSRPEPGRHPKGTAPARYSDAGSGGAGVAAITEAHSAIVKKERSDSISLSRRVGSFEGERPCDPDTSFDRV